MQILDLPLATVEYWDSFPWSFAVQDILDPLRAEIPWEQKSLVYAGHLVLEPRLIAWLGDPDCVYTYSGRRHDPYPWTPLVSQIKSNLERVLNHSFNSVLCNLYRDSKDSIGKHSDNEPELGSEPVIASVSFGDTRHFKFDRKFEKSRRGPDAVVPLTHGSVLVMRGQTQRHYTHRIDKITDAGPRINLTFRTILNHQKGVNHVLEDG